MTLTREHAIGFALGLLLSAWCIHTGLRDAPRSAPSPVPTAFAP